jgi:beta-phosphoglucomutase-like phosphatase (HAD superfamily)
MLGLPDAVRGCLFELDGVLIQTAIAHAEGADHGQRVDGKRSDDGGRSFLQSRGIELPEGASDDPPDREKHRKGKPAPDTFLAGARALGLSAAPVAVFEDALAGVAADRAGDFAFVAGVDRAGEAELGEHGADVVVKDLAKLLGRR